MKKNYRVLIIDDDPDFTTYIKDLLEFHHYEIQVANDGITGGLLMISQKPDLLILDIDMPGINGVNVIQMLRSIDELKNVEILIMSAVAEAEIRKEIVYNPTNFVNKNDVSERLLLTLRKILK